MIDLETVVEEAGLISVTSPPPAINQPRTTPPAGQPANPLIRTLPTYGLTPLPPQASLIPYTPTSPTPQPSQPSQQPAGQLFQPVTRPNQPGQPLQPLTQTTKPPVSIATLPSLSILTLPPRPVTTANSAQGITFTQTTSFDCRGKINDFYADPLSCDYFYICANSVTYRVRCALGLKFNTQLKHCDFAYNVKCQGSSTVQPGLATTQPVTSPPASTVATTKLYQPITFPPVTQKPNQPITTKQPITPKLYQPITNPPRTQKPLNPVTGAPAISSQKPFQPVTNAPSGTTQKAYQPKTNPPAAATPKLYQPLTNPPATATQKPPQPVNNILGSTQKTYVPLTYLPVTQRPGSGTAGNPAQPATQIASSPLPSGQLVSLQGNPCSGITNGLFPHPTQCGKYLQCGFGKAFSMDCPQQLVFNPGLGMCDYQSNYPSCPRANGK
ncbi:peritrophic matrix insect intestinal mucin [Elysia marginata]|uniref:Peritrophic matrix insect intestinal mucin n=1 Tax=Elysia marginata TaxID=1093978 RepID=A0AAV4I3B9_9GAST|nr:peritrophic matrix insect intestinal mucin [Elysia marginata]